VGKVERLYSEPDPDNDDISYVVSETEPVDDRWQGLVIHPPDTDTLFFTFNRQGTLIVYHSDFHSPPGHYWLQDYLFCTTQFSSAEVHIAVCELLRVAEPYMDWQVLDEGEYWESGSREVLEARLEQLNTIIDHLTSPEGRQELEEIIGEEIEGDIDVGKEIKEVRPIWREHWSDSAQEN
jgi:hypothetical protein